MKKTHKKMLGFAGLGLVAAVTTFAATVEVPGASAVTAVSDNIQVRVLTGDPEITVASTSGAEVYSPDYSFTVNYSNILSLKAVLVNRNADGEVIFEQQLFDEEVSLAPGEKTVDLNLDDFNGKGYYTITLTGIGDGNVPVEKIITVVYTDQAPAPVEPEDDKPTIDPEVPEAVAKYLDVTVYYDGTDTVAYHETVTDPTESEAINLTSLADGFYQVKLITTDKNGNELDSEEYTVLVGPGYDTPIEIQDPGTFDSVVFVIKDAEGNVLYTGNPFSPHPGEIDTVDMHEYPTGVYTITTEYYNGIEKIASIDKTFLKLNDAILDVNVETNVDTVTTVEAYIYSADGKLVRIIRAGRETGAVSVFDANGNLLFTLDNGYSDKSFTIPMEGLPYGDYTGTIMYRNAEGKLVGDSKHFKIQYYDKAIIVPDTGSFFQGLNISREDYLITGLVVFMAVGAVAFWLVKRSRKNNR